MIMNERKQLVMFALQQALLGEVSSSLRAITVAFDETSIDFVAFYDGYISEGDKESMSCVETELLAFFPETHSIKYELIRLDYPAPIPKDRLWVFYRKEAEDQVSHCT